MAAQLLRPGVQYSAAEAEALLTAPGPAAVTGRPSAQAELDEAPWNMTDAVAGAWTAALRRDVCHAAQREDAPTATHVFQRGPKCSREI